MKFYTPRKNQGQMLVLSFAYDGKGGAYCRIHDKSDGEISYEYGVLSDEEPEGEDHDREPSVIGWAPCDEPR